MSDRFECEPSVLVAGDFNSLPGDKVFSGLHVTFSEFSCFPSLVTLVLFKIPCMVYVNCTYEFSDSLRSFSFTIKYYLGTFTKIEISSALQIY